MRLLLGLKLLVIENTFSSLPDLIMFVSRALPRVLFDCVTSCFKTEAMRIAISFAAEPVSLAATSKPSSDSLTTCSAASPLLVIAIPLLSLGFFFVCNDLLQLVTDDTGALGNTIAELDFLAKSFQFLGDLSNLTLCR